MWMLTKRVDAKAELLVLRPAVVQEHKTPVACGTLGGLLVGILGVLLPPTMFWGEFEINTLIDNSRPLPHVWPKGGAFGGLELFYGGDYPWWLCLAISLVKMIAISISVLSGEPDPFADGVSAASLGDLQSIQRRLLSL